MNFFESQDIARRRTGRLVGLFVCAVIAIIVLTYLVVAGVIVGTGAFGKGKGEPNWDLIAHPALLLAVGCSSVRPYQMEHLADPIMLSSQEEELRELKWLEAREGSTGGAGGAGGGCACR